MKNEAELCTVIKNSLINGFKIPDPSSSFKQTSKRVFDGIGTLIVSNELRFVCWEAKFFKKPMAFNSNIIEPQQSYFLSEYSKAKNVISYIILGINYGRADKRVFIFNWDSSMNTLYKKGFSIYLKNLNKLKYNKINKNTFYFENIITYNDIKSLVKLKD